MKCLSLNNEEQLYIILISSSWYCCHCIGHVLPFNHTLDDDEFRDALCCDDNFDKDWDQFSYKLFDHMGSAEFENIYPLDEIDPDVNFYNELTYK